MMKRIFVCLANSKKYGERCIAGIELERKPMGGFKIVRDGDRPKWIRPTTTLEMGQVPERLVKYMRLLEIYEIEVLQECPKSYQKENVLFKQNSLRRITSVSPEINRLQHLCTGSPSLLFGNRGKAVIAEKINRVEHSLCLIQAEEAKIIRHEIENRITGIHKMQIRIEFNYGGTAYDFPITDVNFLRQYEANPNLLENTEAVFICTSLGMEHKGWHHKLAAGILFC